LGSRQTCPQTSHEYTGKAAFGFKNGERSVASEWHWWRGSLLSQRDGRIDVHRLRAGIEQASRAITINSDGSTVIVSGSYGDTPTSVCRAWPRDLSIDEIIEQFDVTCEQTSTVGVHECRPSIRRGWMEAFSACCRLWVNLWRQEGHRGSDPLTHPRRRLSPMPRSARSERTGRDDDLAHSVSLVLREARSPIESWRTSTDNGRLRRTFNSQ